MKKLLLFALLTLGARQIVCDNISSYVDCINTGTSYTVCANDNNINISNLSPNDQSFCYFGCLENGTSPGACATNCGMLSMDQAEAIDQMCYDHCNPCEGKNTSCIKSCYTACRALSFYDVNYSINLPSVCPEAINC